MNALVTMPASANLAAVWISQGELAKAEGAYARDVRVFDTTLGARFPNPRLAAAYGSDTMPETGDNVAREQSITREEAEEMILQARLKAGWISEEDLAPPADEAEGADAVDEAGEIGFADSIAGVTALAEGARRSGATRPLGVFVDRNY